MTNIRTNIVHTKAGTPKFRMHNISRRKYTARGLTIGGLARNGKFSFVTILKHVSLTTRGLSGILVDPPRLELGTTEPKSAVLPLHHGSIRLRTGRTGKYSSIIRYLQISSTIRRVAPR